jgi:hypothetical protein
MTVIRSWSLLRQALLVDAVCSGLMGLGLVVMAPVLAEFLVLPASLLSQAGIALIPFAAFVAWLASRQNPSPWAVWTVIGLNVLWVVDSALLLLTKQVVPNAIGYGFIVGQAVVVALFAEWEYVSLRKEAVESP